MNTFSDPIKIIEQFPLDGVQTIADFGSGAGAYSLALAHKLKGNITTHIYAVDVVQDMLSRLKSTADAELLSNIHVIWGDIDNLKGSRLREDSIDLVILANTLFQVEDKKIALQESFRVLKTGGRLILIDWSDSFGNIGPKKEAIVPVEVAEQLAEDTGFIFEKKIDVGEHHYGFISKKL